VLSIAIGTLMTLRRLALHLDCIQLRHSQRFLSAR